MLVSEIMIKALTTVRPDQSVDDAREHLLTGDIRHLPVVDGEGRLVGMLSDRDVLRARAFQSVPRRVSDIMAKHVHAVAPEAPGAEALQLMIDFKIEAVPVVAGGKLVGIVTATDFLVALNALLRKE